jgi:N-acyl homoserine lactone hydrolase
VAAPHKPSGVGLTVIKTGEIPTPQGYVFRAEGNAITRLRAGLAVGPDAVLSPCLAFVIEHPSAGSILVDTGFSPEASTSLRQHFGLPMSLLFRGLRPAASPFDVQLRTLGIDPDRIDSVVMTHLHVDHTSGMRLVPHARFTITRAEWEAAGSRLSAASGYQPHHLPSEDRVEFVDPERDGEPFGPFRRSLDLLGDGTVRLLSTPGHSKGHISLLVRLLDGPPALLVGDAAYTLRSIREELLPMVTVDDDASRRSLRELKAFMEAEPSAIVVPTHDPEAWRSLEAGLAAPAGSDGPG